MRILDDAEVDGLDAVGRSLSIILLHSSQEPGAHVAHGSLTVLKGTGVMQAGGLLLAVVGNNSILLFFQDHFVVRLQEVVVAIDDGVLAVQNAEQGNGGAPCMIDVAINTCFLTYLANLGIPLFHGHIIGRILDVIGIKDILVVVDNPERRDKRDSVIVTVIRSQLLDNAVELRCINIQRSVQGLQNAQIDKVCITGDILDRNDIQLAIGTGQLGSQLRHIIGGAKVNHVKFDIGMASCVSISQCAPLGSRVLIPQCPSQGDSLVAGAGALGSGLGGRSGALRGGSGVSGRGAGTAAGGQAQGHGTCQTESSNSLHFTHNVSPPNKKTFFRDPGLSPHGGRSLSLPL